MATLVQNQLPQPIFRKIVVFERECHWCAFDILFLDVSNLGKQRVFYRLLQPNSEVGVKHEHSVKEIDSFCTWSGVFLCQICFRILLERLQVLKCFHICDEGFVSLRRSSNYLKYYCELILITKGETWPLLCWILRGRKWEATFARKQRLTIHESRRIFFHHAQEFSKYAANSPNIDTGTIVFFK